MSGELKFDNFIMGTININNSKTGNGNTKDSLDVEKLRELGLDKVDKDSFGNNCVQNVKSGLFLMWGFAAKNSGFTDNIDRFLENSNNKEFIEKLIYVQVTKHSETAYSFIWIKAKDYKELRKNYKKSENKNITLDEKMSSDCNKCVMESEDELYKKLAELLK